MHLIVKMFAHRVFYLFTIGPAVYAGGAQAAMATVFG
jgi:hypothetical protein